LKETCKVETETVVDVLRKRVDPLRKVSVRDVLYSAA